MAPVVKSFIEKAFDCLQKSVCVPCHSKKLKESFN
jgi:hypothetical protein